MADIKKEPRSSSGPPRRTPRPENKMQITPEFQGQLQKRLETEAKRIQGLQPTGLYTPIKKVYTRENYTPRPVQPVTRPPQGGGGTWLPEDWNYQAATTGPAGQPLPEGAVGWDPRGDPYYGPGLQGWWNGFRSRMMAPLEPPETVTARYEQPTAIPVTRPGVTGTVTRPAGTVNVTQTIGNFFQNLTNMGEVGAAPYSAEHPLRSGMVFVTRFVKEAVGGLLIAANEPSLKLEQTLATGYAVERIAEKSPLPPIDRGIAKALFGAGEKGKPWTAGPFHRLGSAYNFLRAVTAPMPLEEKGQIISQEFQAGRILYTAQKEPLKREEFIRRMLAGEDPELLEMELMDPWWEMAGRIIFDPLNLLGPALRTVKWHGAIVSGVETYAKLPESFERLIASADEFSDAAGAQRITELATLQKAKNAKVADGLGLLANRHGLFDLTATGKQHMVGRRTGDLFKLVVSSSDNPNDVLELVRARYLLSSDNLDEVANGMATIQHSPLARVMLSNGGDEMGVVLRNLIGDNPDDFLKTLRKAKEAGLDEVIEFATSRTAGALKGMFPTFEEIITAGGNVSWHTKALVQFHNNMQKRLYGPITGTLSWIYMGISPAWAARNGWGNELHVLVDYGPGALKKTGFAWNQSTAKWLGGFLPGGVEGFGPVAALTTEVPRGGMFAVSEKIEKFAASQVVGYNVERTMRQMLSVGLDNVDDLVAAGMPRKIAQTLKHLAIDEYGDVDGAVARLREMIPRGAVQTYRTTGMFTADQLATMQRFGITDTVTDALKNGADLDDIFVRLGEVESGFIEMAGRVTDDVSGVIGDTPAIDTAHALGMARQEGHITDEMMEVAQNQFTANKRAFDASESAIRQTLDGAVVRAQAAGDPVLLEQVRRVQDGFTGFVDGSVAGAARQADTEFNAQWVEGFWRGEVMSALNKGDAVDWAQMWKAHNLPGPPPVTYEELRLRFWDDFYWNERMKFWNTYRDNLHEATHAIVDGVNQIIPNEHSARLLAMADKAVDQARVWDDFVPEGVASFRAIRAQGNEAKALVYARQYKIATATEAGVPNNRRLLNIINQGQPEGMKYAKLDDVPPEIAKDRFRKYAVHQRTQPMLEWEEAGKDTFKSKYQGTVYQVSKSGETYNLSKLRQGQWEPMGNVPYNTPDEAQLALENMVRKQKQWPELKRMPEAYPRPKPAEAPEIVVGPAEAVAAPEAAPAAVPPRPEELLERNWWELTDEELEQVSRGYGIGRQPPPPYHGGMPSLPRVLSESQEGLTRFFDELRDTIRANWGKVEPIESSRNLDQALNAWAKRVKRDVVAPARAVAMKVANEGRDFTLLAYPEKRNIDLPLAYLYPYQFWYSRTYAHWIQRLATHPDIIAAYAKYRDALAGIHAGAPEWWRYNVNVHELLGIDTENPLFFNLEATLNPLQGVAGVDFYDRYKRVDFWTAMLDDLGKFGPSTWTPFSIATALALYMKGEEDAASRWGGRLIPQTAALKSLTALLNIGPKGGVEADPNVWFFSKGLDPYERRRVGRALGWMIEGGEVDSASALEAGYQQEGPLWDQAKQRATLDRAWGNLFSSFLGVGFRWRSPADAQIDLFYNDYFRLWNVEHNLSPDEFRRSMDELREAYPFMDLVLLSRKAGLDRDRGYAYSVIGRIPPGQKTEIAEAVGIPPELLDKFYNDKGHIERWVKGDRERFMTAIVDVGALLEMPDTATQRRWSAASQAYKDMLAGGQQVFGQDIWDRVDAYMAKRGEGGNAAMDAADDLLAADPQIGEALDWRSVVVMNDGRLAPYYASYKMVETYYRGMMYDAIKKEVGDDIFDRWDEYWAIEDTKERKAYWKAHPELGKYMDMKKAWEPRIAEYILKAAKALPEGETAQIRPQAPGELSLGQTQALGAIQDPDQEYYQYTWEDWQAVLPDALQRLLVDYYLGGDELPESAEKRLEQIADELGVSSTEMLLTMIGQSMEVGAGGQGPNPFQGEPQGGGYEYDYEDDNRLTALAKEVVRRHSMRLPWKATTYGQTGQYEGQQIAGIQNEFPESIARREETGFRRYYWQTEEAGDVQVARHELAHVIDAVARDVFPTGISQFGGFKDAVIKWAKADPKGVAARMIGKDAKREEVNWLEAFAYIFGEIVTSNRGVPDYVWKYYRPYIRRGQIPKGLDR